MTNRSASHTVVPRLVQRSVDFAQAPVLPIIDPATRWLDPDPSEPLYIGICRPTLNGFPLTFNGDVLGIIGPRFETSVEGTGVMRIARVRVAEVAHNVGSYVLLTPSNGPWVITRPWSQVLGRVREVLHRTGRDAELPPRRPPTVRITTIPTVGGQSAGLPAAAQPAARAGIASEVTAHELAHTAGHRDAFMRVVGSWDRRLTALHQARTTFADATPELAANRLYASAGGTPISIGRDFRDAMADRGRNFHAYWYTTHGHVSIDIAQISPDGTAITLIVEIPPPGSRELPTLPRQSP